MISNQDQSPFSNHLQRLHWKESDNQKTKREIELISCDGNSCVRKEAIKNLRGVTSARTSNLGEESRELIYVAREVLQDESFGIAVVAVAAECDA